MLKELYIKNIAVIDEVRLNFGQGFHIFTGETGAGKSILVEAIGLVLGEKAKPTLIRDGADEAVVEASFGVADAPEVKNILAENSLSNTDDADELILKRQLLANGNNRIFINHQRATVTLLRELSRQLIDFSGQHEQFELLDSRQDIRTLDAFLTEPQIFRSYQHQYELVRSLGQKMADLEKSLLEREERLEWVNHQIKEISALKIKSEDEEKSFVAKGQVLRSQTQIEEFGNLAQGLLSEENSSILYNLGRLKQAVGGKQFLKEYFNDFEKRLDEINILINDFSYDLAQKVGAVAQKASDVSVDEIEQQLFLLERLKRKFGPGISEIIVKYHELEAQKRVLENMETDLRDLKSNFNKCFAELKAMAATLSHSRQQVARQIEKWVTDELAELKMPGARFEIRTVLRGTDDFKNYTATGIDDVDFLLSTNPGLGLKSLSQIASGGETSRIFLALKQVLTRYRGYGTLIFDEIDTGISGAVVELTGRKLKSLAGRFQVLCITHHAQIASLADTHFYVAKELRRGKTITRVKILTADERIEEVARLMGGVNVSAKTRELARELLGQIPLTDAQVSGYNKSL